MLAIELPVFCWCFAAEGFGPVSSTITMLWLALMAASIGVESWVPAMDSYALQQVKQPSSGRD
jgi:hypothetical protein